MRCVPIDQDEPTRCLECGVDTWEIGEFSYIVERDLWLAAVPWNTAGGMFDFLCIGCLEDRLGRRLTADDFPDNVPMNFDSRDWRSDRLRERLTTGGARARRSPQRWPPGWAPPLSIPHHDRADAVTDGQGVRMSETPPGYEVVRAGVEGVA